MTEDDRDEETRLLILVIEGDMLVFLHDSMYVRVFRKLCPVLVLLLLFSDVILM
jgi:hypothetical protein